MKPVIFALAGLLLVVPPASARIGETPSQILERYGVPDATDTTDIRETVSKYTSNGFRIVVYFLDGISQGELVVGDLKAGERLSDAEIRTLLSDNAAGYDWVALSSVRAARREWRLSDGSMLAYYNSATEEPGLMILTRALRSKFAADESVHASRPAGGF